MANAQFQGSLNNPSAGAVGLTSQNYLTSSEIMEITLRAQPDIRKELIKIFGNQNLGFLNDLKRLGNFEGIASSKSVWFEEDWRRNTFTVQAYNSGGVSATLTVNTADKYTYPSNTTNPYFPYDSITGGAITQRTMFPTRPNDTLQINGVEVKVVSVSTPPNTIVVECTQAGQTIPDIEATDVIIITGNAWAEGTGGSKSRETRTLQQKNFIQIIKDTYSVTGTAMGQASFINFEGRDRYYYSGIMNTRKYLEDMCDLALLTGRKITANTSTFTQEAKVHGVIPSIEDNGITFEYNQNIGLALDDFEDLILQLTAFKGSDEYMMYNEVSVDMQLDRLFREELTAGAVVYSNTPGEKFADLNFGHFSLGSTTFHKKKFLPFNDIKSLGAVEKYKGMMLLMPMSSSTIFNDTGDTINVPSLRVTYQEVENESFGFREILTGGAGQAATNADDIMNVEMRQRIGVNLYGINRFALGTATA